MLLTDWATISVAVLGLGAALAGRAALVRNRVVHGGHLTQARLDQRRLLRLSNRLDGCVVDLERALQDGLVAGAAPMVPEVVSGHLVYLYGLRSETDLFTERSRAHRARLSWADTQRERVGTTAKRCAGAQEALADAADALRIAARTYEEGFVTALGRGDGHPQRPSSADPLVILPGKRMRALLDARVRFDTAMQLLAQYTGIRHPYFDHYKCDWPVLTSELAAFGDDPYRGEVRPLSRVGFGDTPLLHPDAR